MASPSLATGRTGRFEVVGLSAAVAVAALAVLALAGWALKAPGLADFGSTNIPMAPSTALLFILFGSAAFVAVRSGVGPGLRGLTAGLVAVGALVAAVLLLGGMRGARWRIEHLGFAVQGEVAGSPIGHMSPLTAAGFLVASAGLLAVLAFEGWRRRPAVVTAVSGTLVIAGGGLFLLAYLTGEPFLYTGGLIPPAAPTSLAFVSLGLALVAASRIQEPARVDRVRLPRGAGATLVGLFVVLAAGVVLAGVSWFRGQERRLREQVDLQVAAIAKLKATEIARWRAERRGDGEVLQANRVFRRLVRELVEGNPSSDDRRLLEEWLSSVRESHGYASAEVLGVDGTRWLSVPSDAAPNGPETDQHLGELIRAGETLLLDLHRHGPADVLHMGVLVPIVEGGRARGATFLRIDAREFLGAFLEYWPVPSRTAATVLVRREGNEAVVLNRPGSREMEAVAERLPIGRTELPSVRAALREVSVGIFRDVDGRSVVAATHPVPGSPWGLVASEDVSEAYTPLRERLWLTVLVMAGLLAAVGAGTDAVWRRQLTRLERERRLAEAERASLRDVIERSLNEIFVFDTTTFRFRFANRGAVRNLGHTEEELLRMTPLDLVPGMRPEELGEILRTVDSRSGEVHRIETVHGRKDGTRYPVEVHLQRVAAPSGDVYLAVINDISQRRADEERIRQLNRVYAVLSDVNQAIVRWREVPTLAAEACRIAVEVGGFRDAWLFLSEGPVLTLAGHARFGKVNAIPTPDETSPRAEALASRAIRDGRSAAEDGAGGDREGDAARPEPSDARGPAAALPLLVNGEAAGAFVLLAGPGDALDAEEMRLLEEMALDIGFALETIRGESARRQAEQEVRQLNAELERRVAERTEELAGAIRELETFAYSVSHDLKAPLRAIDGYSQVLIEEHGPALDARARGYLERVRNGARRMGELIDALLAYSRIERRALQAEPISLGEVVRSVLGNLQDEVAATGAFVTADVAGLVARADREGLGIVLRNLIGNALKFSRDARPPRIEVGGERSNGCCRFWVRDNGIGFDPDYHDRIFEIFQRLHRQDEFPGTGIGLALVKKAVERMGGAIRAESAPGQGATFFVELPCAGEGEAPVAAAQGVSRTSGTGS